MPEDDHILSAGIAAPESDACRCASGWPGRPDFGATPRISGALARPDCESVARLQNIAEHEKDFETLIVGAVYELDTGRVRILK